MRRASRSGPPPRPRVRIQPKLIRTRHDLKAAIARISQEDAFVIDVETNGLDHLSNWCTWVGLASYGQCHLIPIGHTRGRMLRAGYSEMVLPPEHERELLQSGKLSQRKRKVIHEPVFGDPGVQLDPAMVFDELGPLLFSDKIKIGHNVKFDMMTVAKYYGGELPPPPYEDTIVMAHIVDENRIKYDLKSIVLDMFRIMHPEQRKAWYPKLGKTITQEPIDAVARYLAKDCYDDWLLWKTLRRRLDMENMMGVLGLEMAVYPAIMRMEMSGAVIDIDRLHEIGRELEQEIELICERVWTMCKEPFDLSNPNKKRDLLFHKRPHGQGLAPLKYTPKTNQPVLDQATLEHYAEGGNALAKLFLEWSEAAKLQSTYILGIESRLHQSPDGHMRVHTQFPQHATVTGRFSSRDPNLQNIPRGDRIRDLFVAPPGYTLVVADYDQIELRVLAHYCGDENMIGIFQRGEDIHAGTAAALLGKSIDAITSEERTVAGKTVNFAVSYGAGIGPLLRQGIEEGRARRFLDRYNQMFPAVGPWKRKELIRAHHRGDQRNPSKQPPYVTTMLGRRRRLPDLYSDDRLDRGRAERQAINHIIQGTAAEIMKIALVRLDKAFIGTPFKALMTVHDEVHSLAPDHLADEAKDIVVTSLSGISLGGRPIIRVPLEVSCGTATSWSQAKG